MKEKFRKIDWVSLSKLILWFKSLWIFIGIYLGLKLLVRFTLLPDSLFQSIGSHLSRLVYSFSSYFSFSLGDVLYLILSVVLIKFIVNIVRLKVKKHQNRLKIELDNFFKIITLVYVFFFLIWGYNYYKKPLHDTYSSESLQLNELKELAFYYYEIARKYREEVGENEFGVFSPRLTEVELNTEIRNSVYKIQQNHPEINFVETFGPNLKPSIYSFGISYLGISGYYNPFTAESQYNTKMPKTGLIFTKLHETAHQFGFAPENEANFIGFLLGIKSESEDLIYVSSFRAMRSVLNRIYRYDSLFVKDFVENKYSDGMKRDREFEIEFSKKYGGVADDMFSLMNEAFLMMNNQEGLESYGRFVDLLIGFHRNYPLE